MNRTARTALVTCGEHPALTPDDRLTLEPLARRGFAAEPAIWDAPEVRWEGFDRIIVRSCWDYHHKAAEFARWLDRIGASAVPVSNPVPVLQWNAEKTYLRELEAKGIPVPPTRWVGRNEPCRLADIAASGGQVRSVVKPTVSASAFETWTIGREVTAADEARFQRLVRASGVMVQKFMEPIESFGEWSLMFFAGRFSHAVVKRPQRGDFRVQEEFGGTVDSVNPPRGLIDQASRIVTAAPGELLYARVDGVEIGGVLILMELELIEPALFFHADPKAAERFADAVAHSAA